MKRKNAERFYGRRGGGWANDGDTVEGRDRVVDLANVRLAAVRRGDWPEHSLDEWRRRAELGDPHAVDVIRADDEARAQRRGRYAPAKAAR